MDRAQNDTTEASREEHDVAGRYEIRIKGHLDTRWVDWFEGLNFTRRNTILSGPVVAVRRVDAGHADASDEPYHDRSK